ncbi:unnamed protein product [Amoebophrya sp. A25]|nr:unnamed protein product [Amoebophrya sp. A25]|eukprot:GSA25T00009227001.1
MIMFMTGPRYKPPPGVGVLAALFTLLSRGVVTGTEGRTTTRAAGALKGSSNNGAVGKILETLQNLADSMAEENKADAENYRATFQWCQSTFKSRKDAEAEHEAIANELRSKAKVTEAVNRQLKDEVGSLNAEIQDAVAAIEQGSRLRQTEHEDYLREQKGTADSLSMLNRASEALRGRNGQVDRQTLMQVAANVKQIAEASGLASEAEKVQLWDAAEFGGRQVDLQQDNDQIAIQSTRQSVEAVLKQLTSTFTQSIETAQEQEKHALEEYDSLIRLKKQALLQLQTAKDSKDAALAESEQRIAQLKRALQDAEQVSGASKDYISALKKVCMDASNGWAARQSAQQEVLSGLQDAGRVIQDLEAPQDQVQDTNNDYPTTTEQFIPATTSFLQEMSTTTTKTKSRGETFSSTSSSYDDLGMFAPGELGRGANNDILPAYSSSRMYSTAPSVSSLRVTAFPSSNGQEAGHDLRSEEQTGRINTAETPISSLSESSSSPSSSSSRNNKEATFASVKNMVQKMMREIKEATENEDSHKRWCEAEVSKSEGIEQDKSAKLRRVSTKVDNEKEALGEIQQNLAVLKREQQLLKGEFQSGFVQGARRSEKALFQKASQNHQVAGQILQQAVVILQRYNALMQENALHEQQTNFLSAAAAGGKAMREMDNKPIDGLAALQTKYQQLREAAERSENAGELGEEVLGRSLDTLEGKLQQAVQYRENLALQARAELDADGEDASGLKKQEQAANDYVTKLKSACGDILGHYDERQGRREANLKALEDARNLINVDNADEIHEQLSKLANNADAAAGQLLEISTSARGPASSRGRGGSDVSSGTPLFKSNINSMMSTMNLVEDSRYEHSSGPSSSRGPLVTMTKRPPATPSKGGNMLLDLQSLQSISSTQRGLAEENQNDVSGGGSTLAMLPAGGMGI